MGQGRQRGEEITPSMAKKLPKKETEEMRQMRAFYLSMGPSRSYRAVAEAFGRHPDWISGIARAFNWIEDAQARDFTRENPFVDEHLPEINKARKLAFAILIDELTTLAALRGITVDESGIIAVLNAEGMKQAGEKVRLGIDNWKDYKDILDGIRKVVFDWEPPKPITTQRLPQNVSGNMNVQYNLVIEK